MNLEFCPFPSLSPEWHLSSRDIGWSVGFLDANGPPGCHSWLCLWHYYHLWSWKPVAPWLWWLSQSHVFILLRDWKIVGCAILETMGTMEDLSGGRGGCIRHIWMPLLPFSVYHVNTWEVSTGPSALRFPTFAWEFYQSSWLLLNPFSWDISHLLGPLSLALLFDFSLQLRELPDTTLSNMIATSHTWLLSSWNVASPKWDVLKQISNT